MNNAHDKPENIKCCRSSGLLLFIKGTQVNKKLQNFILKVDFTFPVTSILDSRGFFLEFTSVLEPAIFFHSFIPSSCGFLIVENGRCLFCILCFTGFTSSVRLIGSYTDR